MTEFERRVIQDLSVLKTQMEQLMGIGQPGRLHELEARVASHEQSVQRLKGMAAAFGGLLTVVHVCIEWLAKK
jgi:hypothetical protein